MRSLRLDGEADEQFRARADHAGRLARLLVDSCLANTLIRERIAQGLLTEDNCHRNPTVRVEFEQAIAFGGIGETLDATKHKHWGDGPWIMPLEPEDEFFLDRITYLFRESSLYNQRFEQRMQMKELLGREHRKLVGEAKYHAKSLFLKQLTERQVHAIRQILRVEPGIFWRACQGKVFLDLPQRPVQLYLDFGD